MLNKKLVKKRFKKSLKTYNNNAIVQKHMAELLIQSVLASYPAMQDAEAIQKKYNKILEIGCGTGLLTKEIKEKISFNELFLNDIIFSLPSSLEGECRLRDLNFLHGDCEKIEFPQNLDLIISNATFQWVEDFPSLCEKIHSSLNQEGIFAFTTFEDGNFNQIKNITGKSLKYYKKSEIENILSKNFKILYSNSEVINLEFDSVQDVLNHLRLSGVNSLEETNWTKGDLKNFENKYTKFVNPEGKFILTYKPLYFVCK